MTDTPISSGASASLARLQAYTQAGAKTAPGGAAETARRVGQEFEALFLSEMLAPVFEGIDADGLFGGGEGEKMFRSMMVQEYGKAIAQSGGVGIADAVQREILRMQENQR
ncbi:MAG TPA: rod-binding protein [Kiloniellaceae bacterium]